MTYARGVVSALPECFVDILREMIWVADHHQNQEAGARLSQLIRNVHAMRLQQRSAVLTSQRGVQSPPCGG